MAQGSFGRLRIFEDCLTAPDVTTSGTTAVTRIGQLAQYGTAAGSIALVTDEPGGIWTCTTGATDDDGFVVWAGPFKASDGGCVMEARFKRPSTIATNAMFVGFAETLASTPVMPAEKATTVLDFASVGVVAGMLDDYDATVKDWLAVAGDDNTVSSLLTTATGTRAYATSVADEFDIVRVEMTPAGGARIYHDGKLIDTLATIGTATAMLYAVCYIEDRVGSGSVMELDYFYAEGNRDWTI